MSQLAERLPSSSAALLQISLIMRLEVYIAIPQSTGFNSEKPFASLQRKCTVRVFLLLLSPEHPSAKGRSGLDLAQLPLAGTCPLLSVTCSWQCCRLLRRGEALLMAAFLFPSHEICYVLGIKATSAISFNLSGGSDGSVLHPTLH